jgi:hypothetical protein
MKILYLGIITCLTIFVSSCSIMLNLSEPFIPEKKEKKIEFIQKFYAEPDSIMEYVRNSEFYDEEYSKYVDTCFFLFKETVKQIKEIQNKPFYIKTHGPYLFTDDEFGKVMEHHIFLFDSENHRGFRLLFYRRGVKWKIVEVSHIITEQMMRW